MNFLGHAYIARNNPELIAGNFAGDSYKGYLDNFNHIPKDILNGVKLHRFIDDFTDNNTNIEKVARIFKGEGIAKVSFIACDIILDHHLSANWSNYSDVKYEDFILFTYLHTDSKLTELPQEFKDLYSMLKKYGWLYDYPTISGIHKILSQFSNRVPFENELPRSVLIYEENQTEIDKCFKTFLKEINEESNKFILENLI